MRTPVKRSVYRRSSAIVRKVTGSEAYTGLALVLVAVLAASATIYLYVNPPNRTSLAFVVRDGSSIDIGQDVRVAGLTVGQVSDIELRADDLLVHADIDSGTHIGSESRVEVRMLTPVGGYAVSVISRGKSELGGTAIPLDRVSVPYSIGDVLQEVPSVTDEVDGTTVDSNLDQLATALNADTTSVTSIVDGMKSITGVMAQQRSQIDSVATLSAEYFREFNANREFIFDLVRQIDILLSTYNANHVGFNEAYRLLGGVLMSLEPVESYYLDHSDQLRGAIDQFRTAAETAQATAAPAIDNLMKLRSDLVGWLGPDGLDELQGGTVMVSDICVPVPGRTC